MPEHPMPLTARHAFHTMEARVESPPHSIKIQPPVSARRPIVGGLIRRGGNMKSFWTGTIAAVIIAVVAGFALNATSISAGDKYSTSNVRLH
jgi:hypothetical protein